MDPRQFLPLTPHAFHILLSLIDGELHGYHRDPLHDSSPPVEDGLITETEPRALDDADERRRYYAHTPLGLAVTKAEATGDAAPPG
ncbi:MAG: hypothetical protein ABI039_13130, partial [Vicinamibacterales bacterium]